jgi:glycerol-3-phosphate responsive antiterminator
MNINDILKKIKKEDKPMLIVINDIVDILRNHNIKNTNMFIRCDSDGMVYIRQNIPNEIIDNIEHGIYDNSKKKLV